MKQLDYLPCRLHAGDAKLILSLCMQEVVLSEQSRARDEAEKRMQRLMKQLDYLERARREEEAPLLEANHKTQARSVQPPGVLR